MVLSMLAGRDRMPLDNGFDLRLLSALEAIQARREGLELAADGPERALCSNACLLARALEERCSRCGRPAAEWEEGTDNPTFDPARFEELRGGCGVD